MTAALDQEGILHGWTRDCHGRKHLPGPSNLRAENPSDEVRPNAMIVEQFGTSGAGVQESPSALPNGTPLLMLTSKRGSCRELSPSVIAGRTST